jgi:hypothetical protein
VAEQTWHWTLQPAAPADARKQYRWTGRVLPAPGDGCEAVAAPDAEWVLMYRLGLSRQRIAALVRVPPARFSVSPEGPIFRARVVNVPQVTPLSIRCCDAHERAFCPPIGYKPFIVCAHPYPEHLRPSGIGSLRSSF